MLVQSTCEGLRSRSTSSLAILLVLVALPLAAASADESEPVVVGDAGRRIAEWLESASSSNLCGAVLAAREGQVVAALGVGSADLAGKTPNTPATLFELASASKPFTAIAVVQLAHADSLSLDDAISKHLPGVPAECEAITVRHLLQHTSGIPGANYHGSGNDLQQVLPQFLRGGPQHTPGSHFEYWNQGYALLSEVIAQASGESYTAYCHKHIFQPAGMRSTRFTGQKAPPKTIAAIGRSSRGKPRSALAHPYGSYGFQYRGMGGIVTSVWDLWRWDRALRGDALLNTESKSELFKPGLNDYALGWYVKKNPRGRLVQSHSGAVRGFVCDLRRYPDDDACVFVLCNCDDAPVGQVANAIEQLLFNDPLTASLETTSVDAVMAKALAGTFTDARGRRMVIELDGNAARVQIHWSPPNGPVTYATLSSTPQGDLTLNDGEESHPLTLGKSGNGQVSEISLLNGKYQREN